MAVGRHALAALIARAPARGLHAVQWYFLLFTLLCVASSGVATMLQLETRSLLACLVGLLVVVAVAAVRVGEYRAGRPLRWAVDVAEIAGSFVLVAALGLQPARSLLFGCLMFRAVTGTLWRVLSLQAGYVAVLAGTAVTEHVSAVALGADLTGMVLNPITLLLLRSLLLAGERDRERQHQLLSTLLHNLPTGVIVSDLSGRLTLINQATRRLLGWSGLDENALPHGDIVPLATPDGAPVPPGDRPLARALSGASTRDVELLVGAAADGSRRVIVNAEPLTDTDGQRLGAVVTLHDVTEQRDQQLRLDHLSDHDVLTGLPNRRHLSRRIDAALTRAGEPVTVLQIGLDRFEQINEALGRRSATRY